MHKYKKFENHIHYLSTLHDWYVNTKTNYKIIKGEKFNNVHFCIKKNKCFLRHYKMCNVTLYTNDCNSYKIKQYCFPTTKYHSGPSIKWWERIGYDNQISNISIKSTKPNCKSYFRKALISYVITHRLKYMVEGSSTRNINLCVVKENKVMNTSQKELPRL